VVGDVGDVAAQDGVAGHPPLVLAHVGEGGEPVAVPHRVQPAALDPLDGQAPVDLDRAAARQPDRLQADLGGPGPAAGRDQQLVGFQLPGPVAEGHRGRPAFAVAADRGDLGAGADADALGLEGLADLGRGERLLAGQEALAPHDHGDLAAAEAPERLGELAADRAAAEHDQAFGDLVGPGGAPVVPRPGLGQAGHGRDHRGAAGGQDHRPPGGQGPAPPLGQLHGDRPLPVQAAAAPDQLDPLVLDPAQRPLVVPA
jgi:hypothetical protein